MTKTETVRENECTFGKYKGELMENLPVEYLAWCLMNMPYPPVSVTDELVRREKKHGSRDAVEAAAALSNALWKSTTKKKHQSVGRKKGRTVRQYKWKRIRAARAK